jgi:hypothetical protein
LSASAMRYERSSGVGAMVIGDVCPGMRGDNKRGLSLAVILRQGEDLPDAHTDGEDAVPPKLVCR